MDELAKHERPAPLAEDLLESVAGVVVTPLVGLPPGCHVCTSGGFIDVLGAVGDVVMS